MGWTALLDACVLYPIATRDLLLRGAERYLYQVRWTMEILDEARRNLIESKRCTSDQADGLIATMVKCFPEAMAEGYEPLIDSMQDHPDDRHVLAAAVVAGADVIVSDNVKHFATGIVGPLGVEVQTPDEFLSYSFDLARDVVADVFLAQVDQWERPAFDLARALEMLDDRMPLLAARLRAHGRVAERISGASGRGSRAR